MDPKNIPIKHGTSGSIWKTRVYIWSTPNPVTVTNEGLGWDSLLKMVHNPGGDWHPGWGVVLRYI